MNTTSSGAEAKRWVSEANRPASVQIFISRWSRSRSSAPVRPDRDPKTWTSTHHVLHRCRKTMNNNEGWRIWSHATVFRLNLLLVVCVHEDIPDAAETLLFTSVSSKNIPDSLIKTHFLEKQNDSKSYFVKNVSKFELKTRTTICQWRQKSKLVLPSKEVYFSEPIGRFLFLF